MERHYILWTKDEVLNLPISHVDYSYLLSTEEGVYNLVKSLVDYGVGFIEKVKKSVWFVF